MDIHLTVKFQIVTETSSITITPTVDEITQLIEIAMTFFDDIDNELTTFWGGPHFDVKTNVLTKHYVNEMITIAAKITLSKEVPKKQIMESLEDIAEVISSKSIWQKHVGYFYIESIAYK